MGEENEKKEVETSEVNEVEQEARVQGWVPKDDFRGNEADWIDAETFVKRGREINPILKQNNARLMKELQQRDKALEELRATTEEFKKFQKEQYERKSKELEGEISKLREEKKQAISSGDGDRAVEIDDRIDELREEKRQAKEESKEEEKQTPPAQQVDPVLQSWLDKNTWYREDVTLAAVANAEAERIKRYNPYIQGQEFLDELDKNLEEVINPERLGRKKKPRSPVEGAKGGSSSSKGGKGYDDLPADAKAACDKFVKQKLMSREEYVAIYQW